MKNILYTIILSLCITGCTSSKLYDETYRTNKLREVYPAEITTRMDVRNRLQQEPEFIARRPEKGWANYQPKFLSQKLLVLEATTSKQVSLVERYREYDPRSSMDWFGLCNLWFYYDGDDKLIDVEWQYHSS